ncbi:DUF5956 family protein [Paenarthrobacter nitroguajacolicus]|uniref:DUF5956 family protein n=1 Tax=Paenarthrobacter nitroguajacolicus TaxID=211146 RepID=UPI004055372F
MVLGTEHACRRPRASHESVPRKKDQEGTDQDLNAYLRDGGIEARPSGFEWFIQLPLGFSTGNQLDEHLNQEIMKRDWEPRYPTDTLQAMTAILRPLYEGPGSKTTAE